MCLLTLELKVLEIFLGMSQSEADDYGSRGTDEGGKMKESGTKHWNSPNEGATNESGFSGLPGGYRNYYGDFFNRGYIGFFWSVTEFRNFCAWVHDLHYKYSGIERFYDEKPNGFSVRCVRD